MRPLRYLAMVLLAVGATECAHTPGAPTPGTPTTRAPATGAPATDAPAYERPAPGSGDAEPVGSPWQEGAAALTTALDELTAGAHEIAVTVINNKSPESYVYGADGTFETASIVKVEILAALLLRAQDSGRPLTAHQLSLAEAMIRDSDDNAASAFWWQIGGPRGLAAASERLGLTATVGGADGWWGWTTTTVADQARMITALIETGGELNAESQGLILDLMGSVRPDQAWGVSAATADGETVQIKNGWMSNSALQSNTTINSIGRITGECVDVTIAVLSGGTADEPSGIALVERAAALARRHLGW
jgi:hypothetical protein